MIYFPIPDTIQTQHVINTQNSIKTSHFDDTRTRDGFLYYRQPTLDITSSNNKDWKTALTNFESTFKNLPTSVIFSWLDERIPDNNLRTNTIREWLIAITNKISDEAEAHPKNAKSLTEFINKCPVTRRVLYEYIQDLRNFKVSLPFGFYAEWSRLLQNQKTPEDWSLRLAKCNSKFPNTTQKSVLDLIKYYQDKPNARDDFTDFFESNFSNLHSIYNNNPKDNTILKSLLDCFNSKPKQSHLNTGYARFVGHGIIDKHKIRKDPEWIAPIIRFDPQVESTALHLDMFHDEWNTSHFKIVCTIDVIIGLDGLPQFTVPGRFEILKKENFRWHPSQLEQIFTTIVLPKLIDSTKTIRVTPFFICGIPIISHCQKTYNIEFITKPFSSGDMTWVTTEIIQLEQITKLPTIDQLKSQYMPKDN